SPCAVVGAVATPSYVPFAGGSRRFLTFTADEADEQKARDREREEVSVPHGASLGRGGRASAPEASLEAGHLLAERHQTGKERLRLRQAVIEQAEVIEVRQRRARAPVRIGAGIQRKGSAEAGAEEHRLALGHGDLEASDAGRVVVGVLLARGTGRTVAALATGTAFADAADTAFAAGAAFADAADTAFAAGAALADAAHATFAAGAAFADAAFTAGTALADAAHAAFATGATFADAARSS